MIVKTHQGASTHTVKKELEIRGLTNMRANQFKNKFFRYRKVLFADVFCGQGRNNVNGEMVDGSPLRIVDGYLRSVNEKTKITPVFWFSDIRKDACDILEKVFESRYGGLAPLAGSIKCMSADNAVNEIGDYLSKNRDTYLCLTLDPNGPKDFPKLETQDLISSSPYRVDVNPYISANALNRQLQARNKAGYQLTSWIAGIENFDSGFVQGLTAKNRKGWIRKPIAGDKWRWTMIPTFGWAAPSSGWEKQGFVPLGTDEAKETIKFYCGGL